MSRRIITPPFRANFPYLFKPQVTTNKNEKGELITKSEYTVQAIFEPGANLKELEAIVEEAKQKKWDRKRPVNLRTPFRKHEEKAVEDRGELVFTEGFEAGGIWCTLKNKQKPEIIDQRKQEVKDEYRIYSGVWLRASITAYAYDNLGNKGVRFNLHNVQIVKDDAPLMGRKKAIEEFEPLDIPVEEMEEEAAADPLA